MILALDTATAATTVALWCEGEVRAEITHVDARRHCEHLAVAIAEVLTTSGAAMSDVERVVVGVGPGAYTGLRVGLATARAISHALSVPVSGVMTLDALAFASGIDEPFTVVTDARRREVFWATYTNFQQSSAGPDVGLPDGVAIHASGGPVVGAAATPFADQFDDVRTPDFPAAGALARLAALRMAAGANLLAPEPLYLRRPDVSSPAAPKSVLT